MDKRMKNITRALAAAAAALIAVCCAFAFDENGSAAYADSTTPAVNLGTGVLETGANTAGAQTLWFGKDTQNAPIPWYVIGADGTGLSTGGALGLLAKNSLAMDHWDTRNLVQYDYCELYWYMERYEGLLDSAERNAVKTRYFDVKSSWEGLDTDWFQCQPGVIGINCELWPLTIKDAARKVDQSLLALGPDDPDDASNCWWLGSRGYAGKTAAYVRGDGTVDTDGEYILTDLSGESARKLGVRPGCFLGTGDILLTTDAENGKASGEPGPDALREVTNVSGSSGWKATFKAGHNNFTVDTCRTAYDKDTKILTVPYQYAKTGDNEYISVIVKGEDGTVRYYGRVSKPSSENGSVTVDLDGKFAAGDKLYVFNERYNGSRKTDYASALTELPVTYNEDKAAGHDLRHNEKYWPKVGEVGHDESWTCNTCGWRFADAEAQHRIYGLKPIYMVTVSPETVNFGTESEGYAQPAPKTVTVTNNGNYAITLEQPDLGSDADWTCSQLSTTSLGAGQTATFTVSPKTGLTPQDTFTSKSYNRTASITYRDDRASAEAQTKLQFSVKADVETISGFYAADGTKQIPDQGPEKLLDSTTDTKWCNSTGSWEDGKCFVEFETDFPLTPKGYFLYTGDDTNRYPDRNPTDWALYGKTKPNGAWRLIDQKESYTGLPDSGKTRCEFAVDNEANDSYKYFRFEVSGIKGGDTFQLSELELIAKAPEVTYLRISPCRVDFGSEPQGYEQPEAKTIRITNAEASDITLTQPEPEYYDVSELSKTTIAQGETAEFTVAPKEGLISGGNGGKGIYDEALLIDYKDQNGKTASRRVNLAFYVRDDAARLTGFRLLDGTRGEGENYLKYLIDGDRETTYLSHSSTWNTNMGYGFVDFETDEPVVPEKLVLVTAKEDTGGRSRHPWHFRLYGKNRPDGTWTQLYQIEWAKIEMSPLVPYEYEVNNDTSTAYRYYRWECYRTTNDIGYWLGEIELIATPRKQGSLRLSTRKLDFGTWSYGYEEPDGKAVEITNTEVVPVTLEQPAHDNFKIGALSKKTLQPGETATFTVAPKTGLAPGDYSDYLKIHYNDGEDTYKILQVDFNVTRELISGFTVTDSSPGGTKTGAASLVDADVKTKWANNKLVQWDDGCCFVEFRTGSPLIPKGYMLTTCDNTENNPDANPKDWKLFGKNEQDGRWVLLDSIRDDDTLEAENTKDYFFPVENARNSYYQEYRFEVSDVKNGTNFQLAELRLIMSDEQPGYLNVDPSEIRFQPKTEGYEEPETKNVTITNFRLPAVTLQKPAPAHYDVGRFQKTTLKKGESMTFTIRPKTGLLFGSYDEDLGITYTDSKGVPHTVSVPLHFIVEAQGSWVKGPDGLQFLNGTPGNKDETVNQGPEMLLDGNVNTKWCNDMYVHWPQTNGKCYIDFKTAGRTIPTRYSYTTAEDSYYYQGRIPREWKLFARNSEEEPWTVIDSVNKDQGNSNFQRFEYAISNDKLKAYEYYRFEVVLLKFGTTFQLSELELFLIPPKTVTFDPNGGTVDPASMETGSGRKIEKLPVPENGEEKFAGWFTEPEGGERVTEDTVFNDDRTVYAHWGEEPGPEPPDPPGPKPKKQNPAIFRGKTVKARAKVLKKKAVTFRRKKAIYIAKKKGTVTYAKVSVSKKKFAKKFLINKKTGKITVKRGVKKGIYRFRIRVRDSGNRYYKAKSKVITVTVKVR